MFHALLSLFNINQIKKKNASYSLILDKNIFPLPQSFDISWALNHNTVAGIKYCYKLITSWRKIWKTYFTHVIIYSFSQKVDALINSTIFTSYTIFDNIA